MCTLLALIVLNMVLLIVLIVVKMKLGSPVLFKQEHLGLHEKIFTLYKFRNMIDERRTDRKLMPDDVRLTKFGRVLRSTSLDEMSLI